MKKVWLILLSLLTVLALASCAKVDNQNSFQSDGNLGTSVTTGEASDELVSNAPDAQPTTDPGSAGFNG